MLPVDFGIAVPDFLLVCAGLPSNRTTDRRTLNSISSSPRLALRCFHQILHTYGVHYNGYLVGYRHTGPFFRVSRNQRNAVPNLPLHSEDDPSLRVQSIPLLLLSTDTFYETCICQCIA
ncbi:hypothetical protein BDV18DRAFT_133999 [Aspergillus unguis]